MQSSPDERIRVGRVGGSPRDGLVRALQTGFGGSRVSIETFSPARRGLWKRLSMIDVLQVTAFSTSAYWMKAAVCARLRGKAVVRYWVGTDVLYLQESTRHRRLARMANGLISANVVQWTNLQEELAEMGIRSVVLPGPHAGVLAEPVEELPERFTLLAYLDDVRWSFYGGDVFLRLAREHPHWHFLVLNHDGEGNPPLANVEYLGRRTDMDAVYCRASVLVRFTDHDGLPRMILQALGRGLHVVWNQAFLHCHKAESYDELENSLRSVENGKVNTAGREYVLSEFHPQVLAQRWFRFYESLR